MESENTHMENIAYDKISDLIQQIELVIKGKTNEIKKIITCLLAEGHILIEDNPGSGKTVTARTLAATISGSDDNANTDFKRIQFTPDLLPMDLLGAHIFDEANKDFIFKKGPLFTNILLADEINRASPKVQSALLEAMAEGQITMGEITYKLDELFFVIATQNPIEMEGTYPLPAAQLDRFMMKIIFGYVDEDAELNIYHNYQNIHKNLNTIQQVISKNELLSLRKQVNDVQIHNELIKAVANIVRASRVHAGIQLGASTRAGIALIKCIKAHAMVQGRDFVIDQDIADVAYPVLHHRLIYKNYNAYQTALYEIIDEELKRLNAIKTFDRAYN